jgi:hypothetical protein
MDEGLPLETSRVSLPHLCRDVHHTQVPDQPASCSQQCLSRILLKVPPALEQNRKATMALEKDGEMIDWELKISAFRVAIEYSLMHPNCGASISSDGCLFTLLPLTGILDRCRRCRVRYSEEIRGIERDAVLSEPV